MLRIGATKAKWSLIPACFFWLSKGVIYDHFVVPFQLLSDLIGSSNLKLGGNHLMLHGNKNALISQSFLLRQ